MKNPPKNLPSAVVITPVFKNQKNSPSLPHATEAGETIFAVIEGQPTIFVGLGEEKEITLLGVATTFATAIRLAEDKKYINVVANIPAQLFKIADGKKVGETMSRLADIAIYRFHDYHTNKDRHTNPIVDLLWQGIPVPQQKDFAIGMSTGSAIARATNFARDLGNHPPSYMNPEQLAREVEELGKHIPKLAVTVLRKKEIEKEKMGGVLGVSSGSAQPPTFIIMEYAGGKKGAAPIALMGKGVTFDAGGISIKPSSKMDEMKFDMMGGATVVGAVLAAAKLQLPINVVGLIPATENLPSGTAMRPGDILHMHSGKTVEVLDTDAEGRLILADALSYARRFKPAAAIDLATLTGACVVALGESYAGLWSTDEKLTRRISAASEQVGEKVWPMPLGEDFSCQIKSEVADIKNLTDRWGSANTAAAFLQEFAPTKNWAHLDIAGVAYSDRLKPVRTKGATGWGVALLVDMLRGFKVQ